MKWIIDPNPNGGDTRHYRISDPPRFYLSKHGPEDRAMYVLADGQERVCVGTKAECDARADYLVRGIGRRPRLSESKE